MKGIKRLLVLQHLEIEGPGLFKQFAEEKGLKIKIIRLDKKGNLCLLYTSPSPRDGRISRMPSSA